MSKKVGKIIIQVTIVEEDEAGEITGELTSAAVTVFGLKKLHEWADEFEAQVQRMNE